MINPVDGSLVVVHSPSPRNGITHPIQQNDVAREEMEKKIGMDKFGALFEEIYKFPGQESFDYSIVTFPQSLNGTDSDDQLIQLQSVKYLKAIASPHLSPNAIKLSKTTFTFDFNLVFCRQFRADSDVVEIMLQTEPNTNDKPVNFKLKMNENNCCCVSTTEWNGEIKSIQGDTISVQVHLPQNMTQHCWKLNIITKCKNGDEFEQAIVSTGIKLFVD